LTCGAPRVQCIVLQSYISFLDDQMNLHDLETFVSIAQLGGVTRAAGQLHRSQPAITRRINLLEGQLGAPLFERGRGGAMLTEAGRTFLPYAQAVLAALKDGTQAVQALQSEDHGAVSLAIVGTLAGTTIVKQLRRFSARHRKARLELRTANSFEVSDMVRRGEVSLGLRYFGDPSPELVCRQISEERIVVVCSAHHQWSGKRLRDPQQLRSDQWLSLPMTRHRDSFAHVVARQLASAGLDDVPVMAIDSMTAQKRLIEAGIGIALLPESSVHEELRLGTLRTIDVSHLQTTVPIYVLYRKNGYLTGASRTLLTLISNVPVRPSNPAHRDRKRK
jgi:DNA-binding transcriptional LysR family regulator